MSLIEKIETIKKSVFLELNKKESELQRQTRQLDIHLEFARKDMVSVMENINKKRLEIENAEEQIREYREEAEKYLDDLLKKIDDRCSDVIAFFNELKKYGESPKVVDAYIEACFALDEKLADYFVKRRGIKAPVLAEEIRKEYKYKNRRLKELEYLVSELWLEDDDTSKDDVDFEDCIDDEDRIKTFLSDIEYRELSERDRNQLALNRYLTRNHSKEYIGKMYERYIGYLYEQEGYDVEYRGIEMGVKDGGIDLVCRKQNIILLVQCKNWSQHKEIHENCICQLFGASHFYDNYYLCKSTPVFISSTQLDVQASNVANRLGIAVQIYPLRKDYPMIKCNINNAGEKIYHLPFDQMYDKTKIIKSKGEQWALTVEEAEKAGFRRAKRHFFSSGN